MSNSKKSLHTFHIPVMGTGFTIDTPLATAKYGISSAVSLVDDILIEQMRKFWCEKSGEPYEAITAKVPDSRAKRITAYLNLLKTLVEREFTKLKNSLFEPESEITKYYEMLPDNELKQSYKQMLAEPDQNVQRKLQEQLRLAIVPGNIDVNIMTKLDKPNYQNGLQLPYEFSDAASALRGYANSDLSSSVIFSAGYNPSLYNYTAQFADFFPDENNQSKKEICLKVSDFRSALVQGKYLAKHGLWVSEYRIESALNCGGHAFINDGSLLGPILEEFKQRKDELVESLDKLYKDALKKLKKYYSDFYRKVRISVQGGVGNNQEHEFLQNYYQADSVGWGIPFLLVPEVTNVDDEHLEKLLKAKPEDVFLSSSSPLGVPFWNLRTSKSEETKRQRISKGVFGSFCGKGFAKVDKNCEGEQVCKASLEYQKEKIAELQNMNLPAEEFEEFKQEILAKACICTDLAGGATIKNGINLNAITAICPGPNIINFNKIATLKEMVNHIYGRYQLSANKERVHMFIREIQLQLEYLREQGKKNASAMRARSLEKFAEVKKNFQTGIDYYKNLAKEIRQEQEAKFLELLEKLEQELNNVVLVAE
jgi:hypothetical protein